MKRLQKLSKYSIQLRMIGMMLVCWFVPFLLVAGVAGYYMSGNYFDIQVKAQRTQLKFDSEVCADRLNRLIDEAKKISYDKSIEETYTAYQEKTVGKEALIVSGNAYLRDHYSRNEGFQTAVLWFQDSPKTINCNVYNERIQGSYAQVRQYWKEDHETVREYAEKLNTETGFCIADGRIYMVRNLLNKSYEKMGVLVLRLNKEYCFGKFLNPLFDTSVTIQLNDSKASVAGELMEGEEIAQYYHQYDSGYVKKKGDLYLYQKLDQPSYDLEVLVKYNNISSSLPFYGYQYIIIGMVIFLIPLLLYVIRTFRKEVSLPVEAMMTGSKEIEQGNLGYQVTYKAESSEFAYLIINFNRMSEKLKEQFQHIYEEELALRDARIMALQSHINPHFMNNTLEIINWEARLGGMPKVSKMIEALSTLMDATIDRKKEHEVPLSKEMAYVQAYLYIVKERFGKRLTVEINLPEEIMELSVPRLILQPVIENAIEHGVAKRGNGIVKLDGWREQDYLYLEVANDGGLTGEEKEKIKRLLTPEYDTSKESSGNLGIANVNQRLKIMYGENSGLRIFEKEGGQVATRLTIYIGKQTKKIQ